MFYFRIENQRNRSLFVFYFERKHCDSMIQHMLNTCLQEQCVCLKQPFFQGNGTSVSSAGPFSTLQRTTRHFPAAGSVQERCVCSTTEAHIKYKDGSITPAEERRQNLKERCFSLQLILFLYLMLCMLYNNSFRWTNFWLFLLFLSL